jgi:hypothetical protein
MLREQDHAKGVLINLFDAHQGQRAKPHLFFCAKSIPGFSPWAPAAKAKS